MSRPAERDAQARIVYLGPAGAGKTTNLEVLHRHLRPAHRGGLARRSPPGDPAAHYELLEIDLGAVGGVRAAFQVVAAPGGPSHEALRRNLLERADGIALVLDARLDRLADNLAAVDELRRALAARGLGLGDLPLVVQYNWRDQAPEPAVRDLHRKLDLPEVPVFEAMAPAEIGVLPTLTSLGKRVLRALRAPRGPAPAPSAPRGGAPVRGGDIRERLEAAALEEASGGGGEGLADRARELLDATFAECLAEEVPPPEEDETALGPPPPEPSAPLCVGPETGPRELRVPVRLEGADGRSRRAVLRITLEVLDDGGDSP